MALIKSTILAQISGSIAGTTFSHNRGGAYARSRAMVSNPATTRQNEVRTSMASLASMWGDNLSATQRDEWNAYGASLSVTNRVGDQISLSGIAAFTRVNLFRVATLGDSPTTSVPSGSLIPNDGTVTTPAFDGFSWESDGTAGGTSAAISLTATGATYFGIAVYYSAPISAGRNYFRGPWLGRAVLSVITSNLASVTIPGITSINGERRAAKVILYNVNSKVPIWEVYVPPTEVTVV